jgi:hypothetical protein
MITHREEDRADLNQEITDLQVRRDQLLDVQIGRLQALKAPKAAEAAVVPADFEAAEESE